MAGDTGPWVAGCAIVALAVAGHLVSRAIPPAGAGAPGLKINWNPIPESIAVLKLARRQLAVRNAILGVSWFWFGGKIGRASCRERVCQSGEILVVAVSLKKKKKTK